MFKSAVRIAAVASRSAVRPKPTVAFRALSTTPRVASAHGPAPPQLYGAGGKAGEVPSDIEQATGLERLQLLGEIEGIDVFDDSPLDSSRIGTKANPILVPSYVCHLSISLALSSYSTVFVCTLIANDMPCRT